MSKTSVKILGISCFYHDSAAALLIDGKIVAAAEEERFTRIKHDSGFPEHAIEFCLKQGKLRIDDIDYVVFYEKPLLKLERIVETYMNHWPKGLISFIIAMKAWFQAKLWVEYIIAKRLRYQGKVLFTEHHYAHAASAYYASSFDEAVVVTMDGVGEWDTTTIGYGKENELKLTHSIHFPHSLGLLYSAVTGYLGFKVNSEEYEVMGLSAYGDPNQYYSCFEKIITFAEDGSFSLNMEYFSYEYGMTMTSKKFHQLFGQVQRNANDPLLQCHKDIAASLQKIINEAVLGIVRFAKTTYPSANLCLAGGVALNSVANGKLLETGLFEDIFVFPASGDAGGAVGAACYIYFDVLKNVKRGSAMKDAFLGPEFTDEEIEIFINKEVKVFHPEIQCLSLSREALLEETARLIAENHIVGWFQGRMEFGPRALGARSILADARKKENWQRVNEKIKFRQAFRPFAPAVLEERAEEYFDLKRLESRYMLFVVPVKKDTVPAVTHIDNSARVQTVNKLSNFLFYGLIEAFFRSTSCPVVINTSFNVSGEPIVCTPKEAFRAFIETGMDDLVIENCLFSKTRQ